jgi:glutamate--cysteine ligase catalytic subunit
MRRAQQRDATNRAKFYFRREIFTPTSSRATSGAATPDIIAPSSPCSVPPPTNGIANGFHGNNHKDRPKQRVMENCFPPLPLPEGVVGGNVKEEYGEYTMEEIINGKVSDSFPLLFYRLHDLRRRR